MATNLPRIYKSGIHLTITSHRPPEPFGKECYKQFDTPGVPNISPEDSTFARHPRDRHEPSLFPMPDWFIDNQSTTLEIIRHIPQAPWGARLALCKMRNPSMLRGMGYPKGDTPDVVVAKIFDPIYYHDRPDPVGEADREYAQEAAAYIHLHGQRKKPTYAGKPNLVPHFYGTWSTDGTIEHHIKPFMSTTLREAKDRAAFDTASASSQADRPRSFPPVRIILVEYIKGQSLSRHLDRKTDFEGYVTIRPTPQFENESTRLAIMGSIMDTVSRIEHLGVAFRDELSPSNFIVVEEPRSDETKSEESKYRVVMSNFSGANVTRYTRMGYDIAEKLPLPMHPLSSRFPYEWHLFKGWVPDDWLNFDKNSYDAWGASYFSSGDYSLPDVIKQVCDSVGWADDMRAAGRLPPRHDDSKHREKLKKLFKNMPEWETMTYDNKHNFKSKDDYDKYNEANREKIRERRAKADEERRREMDKLARKVEKQKARKAKKAKKAAEAREADQLEQKHKVAHITGSSTDASPGVRPASSLATEVVPEKASDEFSWNVAYPYQKFKEDMAKRFEAERAAEDEEYRQDQLRLVRKVEKYKARREKQTAEEREAEELERTAKYNKRYNFEIKAEYDKYKEDMAKEFEAGHAKEKEECRQKQLRLKRMADEYLTRVANQEAEEKEAK